MALSFPVSPKKQQALTEKMSVLGIREEDIEESFLRSSGNGGQNVNKVSTAVRIFHKPTQEEVKCNVYRTQGLNRYKARSILCERLESKKMGKDSPESKKHLKIRKAKQNKLKKTRRKLERGQEAPSYDPVFDDDSLYDSIEIDD